MTRHLPGVRPECAPHERTFSIQAAEEQPANPHGLSGVRTIKEAFLCVSEKKLELPYARYWLPLLLAANILFGLVFLVRLAS